MNASTWAKAAMPGARADRVWWRWETAAVLAAALVTAAAWLPFLHTPLTSDESGFLLLAQHWHQGHSLYGNYWVDRPPLLLWLFSVANHLGTTTMTVAGPTAIGVKVLGAVASGTAVLLAGVLARLSSSEGSRSGRTAVVLAVALLSSPLLGMSETDGEVLAVPCVLLGLVCLVGSLSRAWDGRTAALTVAAAASGMGAMLIKQNMIDVFVFALVVAVLARGRVSRLGMRAAALVAGAVAVLGVAVAGAGARGTSVAGLWDAIVVFRLRASAVIDASASLATQWRGAELALAFVASGAAVVLVVAVTVVVVGRLRERRTAEPPVYTPAWLLAWPAAAMVAWELCGVVLGGSYWLHYLTGVVPGLVLLVAIARPRSMRLLHAAVGYCLMASLAVWGYHATTPVLLTSAAATPAEVTSAVLTPEAVTPDARVMTYLRDHAHSSDGVVVGFGHADIVLGSGLQSPYENLWSLPVRVRDPHLDKLRQVMAGPSAPRWIVVPAAGFDTWGVDAGQAQDYLRRHYVEQVTYGSWHIWQRQGPRQEGVR